MIDNNKHNGMLPLVSIVIPVYNGAGYLSECVESCLGQSYPNLEIVVIDDGSTDDSRDVLQPYQKKIVYHYQENAGLAGARNTGHRIAKGKYIAWLDADDIAHPERILLQALYLEKHEEVVLVCTNFSAFDEMGKKYDDYATQNYSQLQVPEGIREILPEIEEINSGSYHGVNCTIASKKIFSGDGRHKLIWGNFIHPPTIMMRKSAYRKAGELKRNIPTQEDWEYFFRISKYGRIAWIDYPLLKYRLHSQQMSSTSNAVKNAKGIVSVFEDMLKEEQAYAKDNEREVRKKLGRFCAGAAYTLIEAGKRSEALVYLKKSFRCNPLMLINYKLVVKWIFF